jgi:isopentenyl-diphosphate delta-isomerase
MKEELVDILDEQMNQTGESMLKSEAHAKNLRHGGAHLWIYNSNGEVLLQLRHPTKVIRPNVWDVSVAGHISAGHQPKETIVREAEEELGLKIGPEKLKYIGTTEVEEPMDGWVHRTFNWTYLTKMDFDLADLSPEMNEVADIRWISLDELEDDINDPEKSKKYSMSRKYVYDLAIEQIRNELKNA